MERDWRRESITAYEEGTTRSPEELLAEPLSEERPLDVLPVQDRAFYRVVYGLDLAWEDLEYMAMVTGKDTNVVLELVQKMYRKNAYRVTDVEKLREKMARAYSRLTELTREEYVLEEQRYALSQTRPVDERQDNTLTKELTQVRNRITRLREQQEQWRAQSLQVLRIPSKEVAQIFNLSPAAVDKRVERLKRRLQTLYESRKTDDEPAET
jgi:Txe/YoeB family toxin of Txe-Axe toxin-antitoxin module